MVVIVPEFPETGEIADHEFWTRLALDCFHEQPKPNLNRLGQAFVEYCNEVSGHELGDPAITKSFRSFCFRYGYKYQVT